MHDTTMAPAHSGLGIASFITSLVAGVLLLLMIAAAGVAESRPGGLNEESAAATLLGLAMLLTALAQMTALGLGIAALIQAGRNKLYGVLGTVFAAVALMGTLLLLVLGTLQQG